MSKKNFLKPPKFDFRESWNWIVLRAGKKVCWLTMHVGMQGLQFRLHKWPKTTRITLYGVANWSSHPPEERRLGFESRHGVRILKGKRSNAVVYVQWHNVHWCMYGLKWEIWKGIGQIFLHKYANAGGVGSVMPIGVVSLIHFHKKQQKLYAR
jgi:hypothetical protein